MPCDEVDASEQIDATAGTAQRAYPRPDYSQKFRCLAEACDENCCSGWSIPIDQQTLDRYRQHPTIKPFADALIVLNTQSPTAGDAARMPLTQQGTCAFLNERKLCGIHANFGPSMLSNACASYPREPAYEAGHPEAALNLSCPEAARLTLLDPNLLGSGPWQTFGPRRYAHIPHSSRVPSNFEPLLALRELSLLIVTDPTYLLWQRLSVLGDLSQRFENLCAGAEARHFARDNPGAVAAFIDDATDGAAFHTLELPAALPDPARQLRFTAEILRARLAGPAVPEGFLVYVRAFQSGLGCDPANPTPLADAQIIQQYQSAYRHYVRPLLDRHPQLIDNFLSNHIFKYSYPFGRLQNGTIPATPTEQHLKLAANLALTQTMLVGIAAQHRDGLTPDHVVRLIQSLSKAIEHRPASVAHLAQVMHEQNLTTPAAQAQLLQLA